MCLARLGQRACGGGPPQPNRTRGDVRVVRVGGVEWIVRRQRVQEIRFTHSRDQSHALKGSDSGI